MDKQIRLMANTFALGLITLLFSHSIIADPKYGKEVSQECSLFELLLKQKAARIIKGVVGNTGRNAPITPKAKLRRPMPDKIYLVVVFNI
jgi:hypothetical protein